ncbi:MAG: thioredoxin family protein [Bacteroidetes bacterium]|nr:thioredoxin family protein [Bacteroidota bacterium]MBL6943561.1 thioredoxin family protein [Bacteroidales bacterium]
MKHSLATIVLLLLTTFGLDAQILEPVRWNFSSIKTGEKEYELIFKADIDLHWHLYSQDIPMSPPATRFVFNQTDEFKLLGDVTEVSPVVEEYDPNFEMVLKYYSNEAIFKQKIQLLSDGATVSGFVEFMSCDDTKCLPPAEVDFDLNLNKISGELQTQTAQVTNENIVEEKDDIQGRKASYWGFFILAFLGGLAAILTPCVFPMIPMTVAFFMKDGEDKAKGKIQAIIYGLSIIGIYVFIGSVLAVIAGPDIANWLSTHWLPNILFFLIFVIFAASFFGMFEITLPSWMINKSDQSADKGGFLGPFFMALTLVLVSFSCTGPIVGTILVESAGGQIIKPIIGMLGFSLAFALPFTLFAFFPTLLQGLPKSGGWLNSVKVVLGFLELALGLKFLSIADQTYHWGILDREVYLASWIVIFFLLGLYLLGKIKFAHDSDLPFVSVPRLMLAVITFTFVAYLIPGMVGAPLKALSGYLPPQSTHDFDLNNVIRENVKVYGTSTNSVEDKELCELPMYSEFLHLPHGLEGYFDYEQALACAREQNKPLFIDFTGHGCVNCREMEANVWADPKVLSILNNDYIVTALYVDDKTTLPEEDWYISEYDGKQKKTIGKKYADLQKAMFGVNAQPYYVLLSPDGKMLTSPRAYDLDINEFVKFLKTGLKNFSKEKLDY